MAGNVHYVVRGAKIYCSCGSHVRRLDMPVCHGSYIREKPMMHEKDCAVGIEANIPPFGACSSPENQGQEIIINDTQGLMPYQDESGNPVMPSMPVEGRLCAPMLLPKWIDAYEDTLVDGVPALTVNCTTTCVFGGVISFIDDGQFSGLINMGKYGETKQGEYAHIGARNKQKQNKAYDKSSKKASDDYIGRYPKVYINGIIKSYETHEMVNGRFVLDNGGKTIGYGHDLTDAEKINGTYKNGLSEKEALDLAIKDLDKKYDSIQGYIKTLNSKFGYNIDINNFTENEILFLVDFGYNRGAGLVDRPKLKADNKPFSSMAILIVAVSEKNDKKVINTLMEETNNKKGEYLEGLKLRRMDEYEILKFGDFVRDYDIERDFKKAKK